jgi:hypothetical protein
MELGRELSRLDLGHPCLMGTLGWSLNGCNGSGWVQCAVHCTTSRAALTRPKLPTPKQVRNRGHIEPEHERRAESLLG